MIRKLLCLLGYHDEWLDEYRVWDQPQMGQAIGRMRVKTLKREYECMYCFQRSTERERDERQMKQAWIRIALLSALILAAIYGVAML